MIFFLILAGIFALLTLATLGQGVVGMAKGSDGRTANKFMQKRVLFQAATIVCLLLAAGTS